MDRHFRRDLQCRVTIVQDTLASASDVILGTVPSTQTYHSAETLLPVDVSSASHSKHCENEGTFPRKLCQRVLLHAHTLALGLDIP